MKTIVAVALCALLRRQSLAADRLLRGAGASETPVEKPANVARPAAPKAGIGGAILGRLDEF